jgi:hypothetical protein
MINKTWRTSRSAAILAAMLAGTAAYAVPNKLLPPETGLYHGSFPDLLDSDRGGDILQKTAEYEALVGTKSAWVVVGNHWFEGVKAPVEVLNQMTRAGKFPIVQVMPWIERARDRGPDPQFGLLRIAQGNLDAEIRRYAEEIKSVQYGVGISFAPEMNGSWYPWSGYYQGGGNMEYGDPQKADGPEIYQDAYKRMVAIFREVGVDNVTWFFHYTAANRPATEWNKASLYYPGDDFVDWVGVSSYSAQQTRDVWEDFTVMMDEAYAEYEQMAPSKPFAVLEFGTIEDQLNSYRKSDWIANALSALLTGRYPNLKGFSYWHERSWSPTDPSFNLRIDSSNQSLAAYRDGLNGSSLVGEANMSVPVVQPVQCYCGWVNVNGAKTCAVWRPGDATLKEYRRFSQCDVDICSQLMSPETKLYCNNTYIPYKP